MTDEGRRSLMFTRSAIIRVSESVAVAILVAVFAFVAEWRHECSHDSLWHRHDFNDHLGAEYDDIARAIRNGKGFSDPFGVQSGSTAWMPPVLPLVLAGMYWACHDDRTAVVQLVLLVKALVITLTGWLVTREAAALGRPWLGLGVFALSLADNAYYLFDTTSDVWIMLLVFDLLWLLSRTLTSNGPHSASTQAMWGLFGGVAALCSPIVGWTWGGLVGCHLYSRRSPLATHRGATVLIVLAVAILVVAPWTLRNRLVMGMWVPVKSNFAFELWQSHCIDDDGILDGHGLSRHPRVCTTERLQYVERGEMDYLAGKWDEVASSIVRQPWKFVTRVANRFLAACVCRSPGAFGDNSRWLFLGCAVSFSAPLIAILVILVGRAVPLEPAPKVAICVYALYLAPYIVISYYDRYGAALFGIKAVLLLYGLDTVLRAFYCYSPISKRWIQYNLTNAARCRFVK
jgi:hypothetical protein